MVRIWPKNFGFETWHLAGQTVAQCLGTVIYTLLLPIHKVIKNAIFYDGMNGICLYFVNKHLPRWPLLGL